MLQIVDYSTTELKQKNITATCVVRSSSVVTKITTHWSSSITALITTPITSFKLKTCLILFSI